MGVKVGAAMYHVNEKIGCENMDFYMTRFKKQYYDEYKQEWKDTSYLASKAVVIADSLEKASEMSEKMIKQFYEKSEGKYRGVITTPTYLVDGLLFVDAYGGEYTTGVKL